MRAVNRQRGGIGIERGKRIAAAIGSQRVEPAIERDTALELVAELRAFGRQRSERCSIRAGALQAEAAAEGRPVVCVAVASRKEAAVAAANEAREVTV